MNAKNVGPIDDSKGRKRISSKTATAGRRTKPGGRLEIAVRNAIDVIAANCGIGAKNLLLAKRKWISDKVILQISRTSPPRQREALEDIRTGIRPLRRKSTEFDTNDYGEVLSRLARAGGWINKGMQIAARTCKEKKLTSEDSKEILDKTKAVLENCGELWRLIRKAFRETPPSMAVSGCAFTLSQRRDWRELGKDELTAGAVKNCLSFSGSFIGKCVRDLPRAEAMFPSREQVHNALVRLLEMIENLWRIRLAVECAATQTRSRPCHATRVARRKEVPVDPQVEGWLRHRQLSLSDIELLGRSLAAAQG
jgi:hypothetical protein